MYKIEKAPNRSHELHQKEKKKKKKTEEKELLGV